jgi:hypothetical protein
MYRMRTENQIKRKLNELIMLKKSMETKLEAVTGTDSEQQTGSASRMQIEQLEESVLLLEWVLDAPVGKYHA